MRTGGTLLLVAVLVLFFYELMPSVFPEFLQQLFDMILNILDFIE